MKKKFFLKFFLFTVIATLVTFTSCKDYDDDISRLDNEIANLSGVKTDLTAVKADIATAQASAAAAQTAANDALAKANDALQAAENAGDADAIAAAQTAADNAQTAADAAQAKADEVEAEAERLLGLIEALEGRVDALEALDSPSKAELQALADEIAAMKDDVTTMIAEYDKTVKSMVTSIRLISDKDLLFQGFLEQANVFVKDLTGAITFIKDKQVIASDFFVIQVSPADAELTPEMISIQNGKGEVYENLEVLEVERHSALVTRATANTGLWKVTVKLKEYEKKAFDKAAGLGSPKKVAFAVAIGNEERKELSEYDLILDYTEYKPAGELFFFVGDKHVEGLKNRTTAGELVWKVPAKPSTTPTDDNTIGGDAARTGADLYPAIQGQPIKIALTVTSGGTEATAPSNIRGMYVTLDKKANASNTEWNSWNSYDYKGLNTVVEATETEIIINSTSAISETIGFRVFAVNHDGTLVDPDGKAFYVSLGKEATDWNAVNTVVTATQETPSTVLTTKSALANIATTKLTGANTMEWTTYAADGTADLSPAFQAYFVETNGTSPVFNTAALSIPADFSKAAKVYTMATVDDWLAYKDNHVYNGKLTIKNATGHVLATLDVTFKKELPTTMEGFSVKTSQLSDGVWNAYLIPNTTGVNWTTPTYAATGEMLLSNVFNFGTTGTPAKFETTFAASSISGTKTVALTTKGTGLLEVAKSFIDNETEHATEVKYNFGKISTETKDASGVLDYKVSLATMKTVYNNIYNSTYTWKWTPREQLDVINGNDEYKEKNAAGEYVKALPYSDKVTYNSAKVINLYHIYGVSTKDETAYNAPLRNPFKISGIPSLKVMSATFVSANGVQEYFTAAVATDGTTITLTPVSATSNPTADVPTTLKIVAKDIYGNDVKIDFPMTVKPS